MKKVFFLFLCLTFPVFAQSDLEICMHKPLNLGPPLIESIKKTFGSKVLIETGTYDGVNAIEASKYFQHVHTIELSKKLFHEAKTRACHRSNITFYLGNSFEVLAEILPQITEKKLFWLDAHYSAGTTTTLWDTHGQPISPLFDEVHAILSHGLNDSIILIDDIRGYPHKPSDCTSNYISINELKDLAEDVNPNLVFLVLGDIAIIYDGSLFSPSISPLVKACTISRLFNFYEYSSEELNEVLKAELQISKAGRSKERFSIDKLATSYPWGDYPLWLALICLKEKKYNLSINLLLGFIEKHPQCHWRTYFYLACALDKAGRKNKAAEYFNQCKLQTEEVSSELLEEFLAF